MNFNISKMVYWFHLSGDFLSFSQNMLSLKGWVTLEKHIISG